MRSELRRLDHTRFRTLVFTNLSQDHLDLHGDMESYFQAKRRLFFTDPQPIAIVNVGDEYGRRLAEELPDAITFSLRRRRRQARGHRAEAARPLQRRERARRARCGAALGVDDEAIKRGARVRAWRPGPVRSGRRGAAVPRDRRLRAQAGRARERPARRARSRRGTASSACSAPAATATAASGP